MTTKDSQATEDSACRSPRLVRCAVLVDAVPVLPDGRGAPVEHGEPGRRGALRQHLVGDIGVPGVGEDRQQVGGGQEPGAQASLTRSLNSS